MQESKLTMLLEESEKEIDKIAQIEPAAIIKQDEIKPVLSIKPDDIVCEKISFTTA